MQLVATKLSGTQLTVSLDTAPTQCPICRANIVPKSVATVSDEDDLKVGRSEVHRAFHCTNPRCERVFVASYRRTGADQNGRGKYEMSRVYPQVPAERHFSPTIAALSPTFVLVSNEAQAAEAHCLAQLVGTGHRKALEFLVKDYAVLRNPAEAEKIKAKPLAQCIREYIPDARVKAVAERAAWLGNDETHYVRTWAEMDVNHLKRLVDLTVHWIELELDSEKLVAEMPKGGS